MSAKRQDSRAAATAVRKRHVFNRGRHTNGNPLTERPAVCGAELTDGVFCALPAGHPDRHQGTSHNGAIRITCSSGTLPPEQQRRMAANTAAAERAEAADDLVRCVVGAREAIQWARRSCIGHAPPPFGAASDLKALVAAIERYETAGAA